MIDAPSCPRAGLATLAGLSLSLMACGFHLEGSRTLPAAMQTTFIETTDPYSDFYRALRNSFIQQGATVAAQRSTATAVLRILEDSTGQRVLSVSARNIPREYEVYYLVSFAVDGDSGPLLEQQEFSVTRTYTFDETVVLGKRLEQDTIQASLAEDLARQVVRRLNAVTRPPSSL